MMRRLLTYHLTFLLLLTNVGVPVFTHVCHTQARSWSSIVIPAKSCCASAKEGIPTGLCHFSHPSESPHFTTQPCCENHHGIIELEADFITGNIKCPDQDKIIAPMPFESISDPGSIDQYYSTFHKPHGPPILLYGRSLLISISNFRC